jgi:hypothetical protein
VGTFLRAAKEEREEACAPPSCCCDIEPTPLPSLLALLCCCWPRENVQSDLSVRVMQREFRSPFSLCISFLPSCQILFIALNTCCWFVVGSSNAAAPAHEWVVDEWCVRMASQVPVAGVQTHGGLLHLDNGLSSMEVALKHDLHSHTSFLMTQP